MAVITQRYEGWGQHHNGKACVSHMIGEQHIKNNDYSNGRTTSSKISEGELARQRQRLDEIAAKRHANHNA